MKRPDGVTVIALLDLLVASFFVLGALGIAGFAMLPVTIAHGPAGGRAIALVALGSGMLLVGGLGALGIAAGWGLLKMKDWARWLTVILSIFALPAFPVGTALGVLVIWYLLTPQVSQLFSPSTALTTPGT